MRMIRWLTAILILTIAIAALPVQAKGMAGYVKGMGSWQKLPASKFSLEAKTDGLDRTTGTLDAVFGPLSSLKGKITTLTFPNFFTAKFSGKGYFCVEVCGPATFSGTAIASQNVLPNSLDITVTWRGTTYHPASGYITGTLTIKTK